MHKYIITYKFATKPTHDPSDTERRQNLIDYFGDNIFEDDNDTTSTLIAKSELNATNLAKDIIDKCELINEDRLLIFRTKKGVIKFVCKVKNKKSYNHRKLYDWLHE